MVNAPQFGAPRSWKMEFDTKVSDGGKEAQRDVLAALIFSFQGTTEYRSCSPSCILSRVASASTGRHCDPISFATRKEPPTTFQSEKYTPDMSLLAEKLESRALKCPICKTVHDYSPAKLVGLTLVEDCCSHRAILFYHSVDCPICLKKENAVVAFRCGHGACSSCFELIGGTRGEDSLHPPGIRYLLNSLSEYEKGKEVFSDSDWEDALQFWEDFVARSPKRIEHAVKIGIVPIVTRLLGEEVDKCEAESPNEFLEYFALRTLTSILWHMREIEAGRKVLAVMMDSYMFSNLFNFVLRGSNDNPSLKNDVATLLHRVMDVADHTQAQKLVDGLLFQRSGPLSRTHMARTPSFWRSPPCGRF